MLNKIYWEICVDPHNQIHFGTGVQEHLRSESHTEFV